MWTNSWPGGGQPPDLQNHVFRPQITIIQTSKKHYKKTGICSAPKELQVKSDTTITHLFSHPIRKKKKNLRVRRGQPTDQPLFLSLPIFVFLFFVCVCAFFFVVLICLYLFCFSVLLLLCFPCFLIFFLFFFFFLFLLLFCLFILHILLLIIIILIIRLLLIIHLHLLYLYPLLLLILLILLLMHKAKRQTGKTDRFDDQWEAFQHPGFLVLLMKQSKKNRQ